MMYSRWQNLLFAGVLAASGFGTAGLRHAGAAEVVVLQNMFNGRYLDAGRESVELKSEVLPDRCQWEIVKLSNQRVAFRNMKNRKYLAMAKDKQGQIGLVLRAGIEDNATKWEIRPRTEEKLKGEVALVNEKTEEYLSIEPLFIKLNPAAAGDQDEKAKADRTACQGWRLVGEAPAVE